MAKDTFLKIGINAKLKAKLQDLANRENRTLTNFIETELLRIVAARVRRKSAMPPRQERHHARLTICISADLKDKLQNLAREDYRNLTDFVETQLSDIVPYHKAGRGYPVAMHKSLAPRPQAPPARLAISIRADLKTALRQVANEQHRTLTDLVLTRLHQVSVASKSKRGNALPRRQARGAQVTMRISTKLKGELKNLANEQYRTLTDFVEIGLRQAVAGRGASRNGRILG